MSTTSPSISRDVRRALSLVGSIFTYPEALAAGISRPDLARFERAGYITRLGRGVYSFTEVPTPHSGDPLVAATAHLAGEPHFVSWWAALARHGLTEQVPFVVSIAVKKARRDREIGGLRLNHVLLEERKWYGFERDPSGVSIATAEKTILDSLDKPELAGGLREVIKAIGSTGYNPASLIELAHRWPTEATVRRLGYLLEMAGLGNPTSLKGQIRRRGPLTPVARDAPAGVRNDDWWVADGVGHQTIRRWARR